MKTLENRKCISEKGLLLSAYSEKEIYKVNELSNDAQLELSKVIGMIVKDYKITVSLESIRKQGLDILSTLDEAIQSGVIKKRTNQNGYVGIDYAKDMIVFMENPKLFDVAINKSKGNKGLAIVEILKTIKKNYNDEKFIKTLFNYYDVNCGQNFAIKYTVDVDNLALLISNLFDMEYKKAKKIIYAMKHQGHYDISVKRRAKRYKGSYISDVFIYLGSVK